MQPETLLNSLNISAKRYLIISFKKMFYILKYNILFILDCLGNI